MRTEHHKLGVYPDRKLDYLLIILREHKGKEYFSSIRKRKRGGVLRETEFYSKNDEIKKDKKRCLNCNMMIKKKKKRKERKLQGKRRHDV